jgi:hypothetical protein
MKCTSPAVRDVGLRGGIRSTSAARNCSVSDSSSGQRFDMCFIAVWFIGRSCW